MNEQRRDAYIKLIQELLNCASGKEREILAANRDLIDAEFLLVVEVVAGVMWEKGNQDTANWLRSLGSQLAEYLNKSSSPAQLEDLSKEEFQAYFQFLMLVLQTIWKSDADTKIVYPLLAANTDKLDGIFTEMLRLWAINTFEKAGADATKSVAANIINFNNVYFAIFNFGALIQEFPLGDKSSNMEIAIASCKTALKVLTQEALPGIWATTQYNLGLAYSNRIKGDKAENIELAIQSYEAALQVRTQEAFPQDWAKTQHNLATAYIDRIKDDKAENIELAIQSCKQALQVRTKEAFPGQWAQTQNNLGFAYSDRIKGDKAENIELAIQSYKQSLQIITQEALPQKWTQTQNNLANAYINRIKGDKAENIELAIQSCNAALQVGTQQTFPQDWATTQINLGLAYSDRIKGDKAENIELAIQCYEAALQVYTQQAFPKKWATTQNNLAITYRSRIKSDKAENIELAIQSYKQALQVYTQQAFPKKWATTQNNLANAYGDRIKGDKAENIELAIQSYEVALQVRTQEAFPQDWAQTQHNLAVTYRSRIKGDKTENFEKTIQFSQAALLVLTQEAFPKENAQTLLNLGMSYQDEGQFNLAYNTYESAIATVELLRGEIISGEESKRKQAEEWNKLYLKMVEVCLQLGKEALALEYIERSKTRNLVELILERDSKIIFPPEVVTQLEQLRDEIATGQYKIQNSAAENTKALAQHLQGLKEQKKSLEDKYLPVGSGFNFKKFQSTLDKNTVIIEWCITNTSFETFIITSDNLQRFNSSTSTDDFWTLIDWMNSMNWVNKYLNAYYNNKAEWINNLTSYLNQLAENLNIEEILKLIPQNYSHLILIPHRFLHLLPLHSLPLLDGSFVCDKFPDGVSYAPSCQILQQAQKREHTDFQSLFAIQNPTQDLYQDYEKDLGAVSAIKKQFTDSYVLKQANAKKAEILHHDENTKLFKLNEKLAQANNIFFFCHGLFNPNYSLDSGLQLADENITLADIIAHFKLENCRLVTLAACETGVIDSKNVSDEYIGLPYGFLLAGSTNVVSSLWTVSATATALLMTKFYEELKTRNNIAVALNITQHWLRDTTAQGFQDWLKNSSLSLAWRRELDKYFASEYSATVKPFESPYYWSAFFVTGKGV